MVLPIQFEAILPEPFREGVIRLYVLNEARKVSTEIKNDLARPTKYWSNTVHFKKRVSLAGGQVTIFVETSDQKYVAVSTGTPKPTKDLVAVNKRSLAFPGVYTPKTIPGTLQARPGAAQGTILVKKVKAENRQGIEPRNFDILVEEIWNEKFPERMQEALEAAADKTGYALD